MRVTPFTLMLIGLLALATIVAAVAGDGDVRLALSPCVVIAALWIVAQLPIRYTLWPVAFLAVTLENPADSPAAGAWKSPLYVVGAALLAHLNLTFPSQKWLIFSGLDLILVGLFVVVLARRFFRSRIDATRVAGAPPMRAAAIATLGAVLWVWLWGMVHADADVGSSLWQVQRVVYLPLVYLLFELAYRGEQDRTDLAKILVAAGAFKAGLALYLRHVLPVPAGATTIDYATTHADSMLFAGAACLVIALLVIRFNSRSALLAAVVLPLLLAGMVANHRRIVWVELGAGILMVFLLSPSTPLKRAIGRSLLLASPVLVLYLVVGWNIGTGVFGPVQTIRSVVDSDADASTAWRDWENYNLFYTLKQAPILGTGYGHGYIETVKLPEISQAYALYRFAPHNSVLGLWAYGGLVGSALLWSIIVVGVFLAVRSARFAVLPSDRVAAAASCAAIVVYLVHCYGDMGLGTWTSVFMVAPALTIISRLAMTTGAWPRPRSRSVAGAPPAWTHVATRRQAT